MKYVDFYGHKVSKLIIGDNPFNGHSYIPEFVSKEEMIEYHTEDKILEAMHKMEELGINTMLPLADPYIIRILQHYRSNGGKMNFIFQTYAPMMTSIESAEITMRQMLEVNPIGIYLSGTYTDCRFETGRTAEIREMIDTMIKFNVKIGIGSHRPEFIQMCEDENWPVDFYMACMYNLRRGREGEESGFITGKSKKFASTTIYPSDRAEMLAVLKNVKKPIIAFKIFAGGQMLAEREEDNRRELIKDTYNTIFNTLKPDDFAVAGIFQKYHDQLTENVSVFNEWAKENSI